WALRMVGARLERAEYGLLQGTGRGDAGRVDQGADRGRGPHEAGSGMMVRIAMIAGVAENGVIGSEQTIPWRVPSDMAFFKQTTMGKPIVMGRKQFETV